ncbi:MAG: putative C-S lyase [Anaerolineae bacterium]|jgi:cystathionine beta-lyase|nr:MAG: putative C-S lyase [Anaerolineae bacterium]
MGVARNTTEIHVALEDLLSHNFDQIISRRGTNSLKWDSYPEEVLPMWVADMDFRSPPAVIDALHQAVEHGIFGYPSGLHTEPNQRRELREVLVERMARLYHWQIQPEDIYFVPGVVVGFNLVAHALGGAGHSLIVQPPIYPPILGAAANAGMRRIDNPLVSYVNEANVLYCEIDFDQFEQAILEDTRLFLLCNPHNPVGRVFTRTELERLAEICLRHGLAICSDEIHGDLIFEPNHHTPIASLDPEIAQNTITLMAPSKTFNIPGLQFSFAIVPNREWRKRLDEASQGLTSWINALGWVAALAAYREGEEWLRQVLRYLQDNRDYLVQWLSENLPYVPHTCPQGTYLAWLDCRPLGLPSDPYTFFLKEAKVAFNDGKAFGKEGEGFIRWNFACPRSLLEEACARVAQAVKLVAEH